MANPSIVASFGAGYSAADQAVIKAAIGFYNTSMTSTFSAIIAFGTQAANTGATSIKLVYNAINYSSYYNALVKSETSAVDSSAVASLGGPNFGNNPVTGTSEVSMPTTLAATLGIAAQISSTAWSQCDGLTGTACIDIGVDYLSSYVSNGGVSSAGLTAVFEHEFDEVLGTSSALPNGANGTQPTISSAADLFRYSAAGARTFSINTADTSEGCIATPGKSYFSVDGGTTNLAAYNNCGNGADYGDWAATNLPYPQVQDAYGSPSDSPFLTLASPEVALLDAVGYNFVVSSTDVPVPEPGSLALMASGLAAAFGLVRRRQAAARR